MKHLSLFFLFLLIGVSQGIAKQEDYVRWVNYTGQIPETAVQRGVDGNNRTIYIGRAYLSTNPQHADWDDTVDAEGYIPGAVYAGLHSIDIVLFKKAYTVQQNIEILTVINNTTLKWQHVQNPVDFLRLFETDNYHPVRAGLELSMGYSFVTYIGSANSQSESIGKIFNSAYTVIAENGVLYFSDNNNVSTADSYEALIYYV